MCKLHKKYWAITIEASESIRLVNMEKNVFPQSNYSFMAWFNHISLTAFQFITSCEENLYKVANNTKSQSQGLADACLIRMQ